MNCRTTRRHHDDDDMRQLPGIAAAVPLMLPMLGEARSQCGENLGVAGLGFAGLEVATLGLEGLGVAGLGFAGLDVATLGFEGLGVAVLGFARLGTSRPAA